MIDGAMRKLKFSKRVRRKMFIAFESLPQFQILKLVSGHILMQATAGK